MLVHRFGDQILLQKRPPTGIWGGLWSLPELNSLDELADWQREHLGVTVEHADIASARLRHQFSHFDLVISTLTIDMPQPFSALACVHESDTFICLALERQAEYGMPAPVARLLAELG
jgi:A/G-specific adenine glycosylase